MTKFVLTLFLTTVLVMPGSLVSKEAKKVAKAIILKGVVHSQNIDGSRVKLKKGDWILEGAKVKTSKGSFAKLIFIDKSQMSIGPSSEMQVESFPRKKAGVINLIRGKVRAKVTKNYLEMDKSKSKLYIKTKTAAMGVRGTDFRVLYNPVNKVTNLLTFEGNVRMAKFKNNLKNVNRNLIEKALARKSSVSVRAGQFSMTTKSGQLNAPTKISPKQLDSLDKNEFGVKTSNTKGKKKKQYRGIVPKGTDAKAFSNGGTEIEKQLASTVGTSAAKDIIKSTKVEIAKERGNTSSSKSNLKAPVAGGYIDDSTALYVPPPKGSEYDKNADVYIPPASVGSVDGSSGDYVPPAGFKLVDSGDFVAVSISTRGPASTGGTIVTAGEKPQSVYSEPIKTVDTRLAQPLVQDPCVINPILCKNLQQFQNTAPAPIDIKAGSRTRFSLGNN